MTQTQKDRQKRLKEIEEIEDDDIRRVALKGNTVNIIYDDTEQIRAAAGIIDNSNPRKLRSELREINNLDVVDEIADY
jgi:adenosine/AMP kinase